MVTTVPVPETALQGFARWGAACCPGQDARVTNCAGCGRPADDHDRHVRFTLPDPVLDVPEGERAARTWGNDVLTMVQGVGAFVRVLVPIRLTGGHTLTYGAWLGVHPTTCGGRTTRG